MVHNLLTAFTGPGGIFSYTIVVVFCYGWSIYLERMWKFSKAWKFSLSAMQNHIEKKDFSQAITEAKTHPVRLLLEVAKKKETTECSWDDLAIQAPLVEKEVRNRISSLNMVANISTMLGLLGTVYGLIYALDGLDGASSIERTARLSAGIGSAMLTTALGLLSGIPAMFAHNSLQNKADDILAECNSIAAQIVVSTKQQP
jgi:biopolymer transport protein ExbB/TolQ